MNTLPWNVALITGFSGVAIVSGASLTTFAGYEIGKWFEPDDLQHKNMI